jgi:hypothetical protein
VAVCAVLGGCYLAYVSRWVCATAALLRAVPGGDARARRKLELTARFGRASLALTAAGIAIAGFAIGLSVWPPVVAGLEELLYLAFVARALQFFWIRAEHAGEGGADDLGDVDGCAAIIEEPGQQPAFVSFNRGANARI